MEDGPGAQPHPFNATISDGELELKYFDVTDIETIVPRNATYTLVYNRMGHTVMYQFQMSLFEDEPVEFEFYALNISTVLPRVRPYLLGKEVGEDINLSWEFFEDTNTLIFDIDGHKKVLVGAWIKLPPEEPNYVLGYYKRDGIEPDYSEVPECWDKTGDKGLKISLKMKPMVDLGLFSSSHIEATILSSLNL